MSASLDRTRAALLTSVLLVILRADPYNELCFDQLWSFVLDGASEMEKQSGNCTVVQKHFLTSHLLLT